MTPEKAEGTSHPMEAPSEEVSASPARLNTPAPTTQQKYRPDVAGSNGERWAKVPVQASHLGSRPLLDLLIAYSGHAGGSSRIAVVSDTRIAVELEWFYSSKATGTKHPHRRKVWGYRKHLEDLGYILPAGRRCIEGKWIDAWVVAPYDETHVEMANKWRLQTYIATIDGAPISDAMVHRSETPGAPISDALVHPGSVHIQSSSTELFTEPVAEENGARPRARPLRGSRPRLRLKEPPEYESDAVIEERRRHALEALARYDQEQPRDEGEPA